MDTITINDLISEPQTPADFSSNVRYARVLVAQQLGFGVIGTAEQYATLSQADQVRLTDEVSVFIAGNPQLFSARQRDLAQRRVGSQSFRTPLADDSLTAATGEFFGEIAGKLAGPLGNLVTLAVVAALAFAILPGAIAKAAAKAK